jgi:hypothetical protein
MKLFRVAGLCLVTAVATSAVAVASASAEAPEYGRCLKVAKPYNGGFTNSGCTTKSEAKTGKYEWYPGVVKKLQTSSGGKGALEEVNGNGVGCAKEHSVGEYSGTKEVKNVVVTFEHCESAGFVCTSPGHSAGELVTNTLEGSVEWENRAARKTELDLYPAGGAEKFIEFTCGAVLTIAVRGSILTPVKPDKMSLTVPLKYKQKRGVQAQTEYETGSGSKVRDVLEANFSNQGWLQSGQTITSTVTNEEKLELNAYV